MKKIFIVEDDDNIREMLIYALKSAGFDAEGFMDGAAFNGAIKKTAPAIILLDIMLPDEDGLSILKELKKHGENKEIPVIMLTAKGAEYDRIKGLDLGADDYITKPFSVMEVISRIRAVLRRTAGQPANLDELTVGGVSLDKNKRTVFSGGEEVKLTYKEFELLNYLMVNEGVVLSRDKILEKIWGFAYGGETRTVDMHIKSLRQKLKENSGVIKTVRNVGYKIGV